MYKNIFGHAPIIQMVKMQVSLKVDGETVGEPDIEVPSMGTDFKIKTPDFLTLIERKVTPQGQAFLTEKFKEKEKISLQDLNELGFITTINKIKYEIRIIVPLEYRTRTVIDFVKIKRIYHKKAVKRAGFSGYFNINASEYNDTYYSSINSVLNLYGLIHTMDFNLSKNSQNEYGGSFSNHKFIYNYPEYLLKFTLGEIQNDSLGFLRTNSLIGLNVKKVYSLDPSIIYQRSDCNTDFELAIESSVELSVNKKRVFFRTLERGKYAFKNIPLSNGLNSVEIKILNQHKKLERAISFLTPYNFNLLSLGEQEFSASVGHSPQATLGDFNQPITKVSHKIGLFRNINIGEYVDVAPDYHIMGGQIKYASIMGALSSDLAFSFSQGKTGWATQGSFNFYQALMPFLPNINLQASYYSGEWVYNSDGAALVQFRGTLGHTQTLFDLINFNVSYYENWNGLNRSDYGFYFTANTSLDFKLHETHNKFHTNHNFNGGETQFSLNQKWKPNQETKATIKTEIHPRNAYIVDKSVINRLNAQWEYKPKQLPWDLNLGYVNDASQNKVESGFTYEGQKWYFKGDLTGDFGADSNRLIQAAYIKTPRAIFTTNFTERFNQNTNSFTVSRRIGVKTAIVFTDDIIAMSAPISDSFMIVYPDENLQDYNINVNSKYGIDLFGPAVIPISPYRVAHLSVDDEDNVSFRYLNERYFSVYLDEKAGGKIKVGHPPAVILTGRLQNAQNNIIASQLVYLYDLSRPEEEAQTLFTNRKGGFQASDIYSGRYRLVVPGDKYLPAEFQVTKTKDLVYKLDTIILQEKEVDNEN
ncbi:hypothetical protein HOC37_04155 [bacterium]|nr:hypothetical protein [bacterium]